MTETTDKKAVELRLLGGFELWVMQQGQRVVRHVPYQRAKALLAILAVEPRTHSREALADRLWPDVEPGEALSLLRRMLHVLKLALGDAQVCLDIRRTSVRWLPSDGCDASVLDAWRAEGIGDDGGGVLDAWQGVLDRYRGPFLAGLDVPSAEFERWLTGHRGRLQLQAARLGLALADARLRRAQPEAAATSLRKVLAIDPTHEDAMALLLRVRQQQGALHTAREEWGQFERAYRYEMDGAPSSALLSLAHTLQGPQLDAAPPPYLPDKLPLTVLHLHHRFVPSASLEERFAAQRGWRQRCVNRLQAAGGHVLQAPTAGLTACFGYPVPRESACEQAVLAALMAVSADTAAGVAWGWVLVPEPGASVSEGGLSALHWPDVGFCVTQEAQQLALQAKVGQLLVSDAVHQTVQSKFEWESAACPASPKGLRTTPLSLAGGGFSLPFRGREDDLAWLTAQAGCLLSDSRAVPLPAPARWSLVEAEAGVGKSHLLQHWLNTCASNWLRNDGHGGVQACWVQARQVWAYAPFHALEAVWGRLEVGADGTTTAAPHALRRAWVDRLVQAIQRPTLLIVEDAHWLDPSSVEVIQALTRQLPGLSAPCWMLLTSRPGHALAVPAEDRRLLGPLTHGALDALAADMAPQWTRRERQRVVLQSGGNTLHLKTLLAMPAEGRMLPTRLSDALQAQIHPLGAARAVAEWAAVLGPRFARRDLERLCNRVAATDGELPAGADNLSQALAALQQCGLIQPDGPDHHRFHHTLQCEALRLGIHTDRLRGMHARVLDELGAVESEDEPAALAERCEAAGRWEDACRWRRAALQHAQGRHALAEVAYHAQAWLRLMRGQPDAVQQSESEFEVLMMLANAQAALQGYGAPAAQALYAEALERALALGQVRAEFAATWALWLGASSASGYERAHELARRLMDLLDGDASREAMAVYAMGNTLVCLGRFDEAVRCLNRLPQIDWPADAEWPEDAVTHGLAFLALAHGRMGQHRLARGAACAALRRARGGKSPSTCGFVWSLVAMVHVLHRNWRAVATYGQRIHCCGTTHELALWQVSGQLMIQSAAVARGEPEAWDHLEATVLALPAIMSGVEGFFLTALVSAGLQSRSWSRLSPWVARGLALPAVRQDRFFEEGFRHAQALCGNSLSISDLGGVSVDGTSAFVHDAS